MNRDRNSEFDRAVAEVAGSCTCANLRKATRAVTQAFDTALAPSGLRATQVTILVALAYMGRAPLTRLAAALVMDRTTLTRNLRPLEREGLLVSGTGEDRRVREIHLTKKGRKALEAALPLWRDAQARMRNGLGASRWQSLMADLDATVSLAFD